MGSMLRIRNAFFMGEGKLGLTVSAPESKMSILAVPITYSSVRACVIAVHACLHFGYQIIC